MRGFALHSKYALPTNMGFHHSIHDCCQNFCRQGCCQGFRATPGWFCNTHHASENINRMTHSHYVHHTTHNTQHVTHNMQYNTSGTLCLPVTPITVAALHFVHFFPCWVFSMTCVACCVWHVVCSIWCVPCGRLGHCQNSDSAFAFYNVFDEAYSVKAKRTIRILTVPGSNTSGTRCLRPSPITVGATLLQKRASANPKERGPKGCF